MIGLLLALNLLASNNEQPFQCWEASENGIHAKSDLLAFYPRCWVVNVKDKDKVRPLKVQGKSAVNLQWEPCDFNTNGFRTEISEPYHAKFHRRVRASWWEPEEQNFKETIYHWSFQFTDSSHLLEQWSQGAFIAQLHSYSHPLDSLRGGSPVIGLHLSKQTNKNDLYKLSLTSKIFRSTGYCSNKESPRGRAYCNKVLATYYIKSGTNYSVDLRVVDNMSFIEPGRVSFQINDLKPIKVDKQLVDESGDFRLPVRQNSQPNYFKIGWYVTANAKKVEYKKNNNQKFCESEGRLEMTITDFSYSKRY